MVDNVDIYVTWVEPLTILFHVIILGIATGAISMVITKSTLFNFAHDWIAPRFPKLEEMLSCPWCTSHWVALFLTLIYRPLLIDWGWRPAWMHETFLEFIFTPVDYLVTIMVMVVVAAGVAKLLNSAYNKA
jgi:hypothetical protein